MIATIEGLPGPFRTGQIIDMEKGEALSFDRFIDRIASKELVFVGENHDNPEHHLIQVQILQALMGRCKSIDVAMEFFQKTQQHLLDRYVHGEITEAEFLKETAWEKRWGFYYHYYRPLLLLAKQNGSRILALNLPHHIVKKVARQGLKGLDESEREQLPEDIDLTNKAHRAFVREAFAKHGHENLKNFDFFYEAQCVWEDTMASHLSDYFKKEKGRLIVFSGNGHIIYKFGIPNRTFNRVPVSMATIMPYPVNVKGTLNKGMADYIWLTAGCAAR
ncbi:MAG: ChaN family lipoprotein [Pseudomonadota bacterium]